MTVNLLRMAVGCESVDQIRSFQEERRGEEPDVYTFTRNVPKRIDELIDGGSIYWVVKRFIQVRQRILGIEKDTAENGRPFCRIRLQPELVRTELRPHRAFQGWRYLPPEDAPPDIFGQLQQSDQLPREMAEELRELGLL
jgi:hypothetical protein